MAAMNHETHSQVAALAAWPFKLVGYVSVSTGWFVSIVSQVPWAAIIGAVGLVWSAKIYERISQSTDRAKNIVLEHEKDKLDRENLDLKLLLARYMRPAETTQVSTVDVPSREPGGPLAAKEDITPRTGPTTLT